MPREARAKLENSCYHIITRGNQKQTVFHENHDYEKFMGILLKYKKRYKFKVYSFCLMPNHVHLIIQVVKPNSLGNIMKCINLSYAVYFNAKYNKVGHLWQGRYKSKIIGGGKYLLECVNYTEANPVRAMLTKTINDYPWSSFSLRMQDNKLIDDLPQY